MIAKLDRYLILIPIFLTNSTLRIKGIYMRGWRSHIRAIQSIYNCFKTYLSHTCVYIMYTQHTHNTHTHTPHPRCIKRKNVYTAQ